MILYNCEIQKKNPQSANCENYSSLSRGASGGCVLIQPPHPCFGFGAGVALGFRCLVHVLVRLGAAKARYVMGDFCPPSSLVVSLSL